MLDSRTVIESIRDGATMTDVIEYISAWILEARTLADALDAAYFTNGLPEEKDKNIFFGKATRGFHTLEMSLAWIQGAVDTVGAELFTQEQSESIRKRAEAAQLIGDLTEEENGKLLEYLRGLHEERQRLKVVK